MTNRQIYRLIAKKHGVTVIEVKRDMQCALDQAWEKGKLDGIMRLRQQRLCPGCIAAPTPDQFLCAFRK